MSFSGLPGGGPLEGKAGIWGGVGAGTVGCRGAPLGSGLGIPEGQGHAGGPALRKAICL